MVNEQELNKKLAEWASLPTRHDYEPCGVVGVQTCKVCGEVKLATFKDCNIPNFTQSLDACFKWLIPKLHAYVLQSFSTKHHLHHTTVVLPYTSLKDMVTFSHNVERTENPALALCLAIEKLIDKEK